MSDTINPYESPANLADDAGEQRSEQLVRFKPARHWGTISVYALAFHIPLAVLNLAFNARLVGAYSGLVVADYMNEDWVASLMSKIQMLFFSMDVWRFITASLVITWLYRAHQNLPALGHTTLDSKPVWAIVCWFVPIMNVFAPYQVVHEVWWRSAPPEWNLGPASRSALLIAWWTAWLTMMIVAAWSRFSPAPETPTDMVWIASRDVAYLVAAICGAGLMIAIILQVNRRQVARFLAMRSVPG